MRKSKPVIILLSIQLIFSVAVALINPVTNLIVRTFGTEHIFETSEVLYYGNLDDETIINCRIKYGFEYDRFEYVYGVSERYAVIGTDENGLSYISSLSHSKPESGDYLGTGKYTYPWYDNFEKAVDSNLFKKVFSINPPMFHDEDLTLHPDYKFTVKVHIYKGTAILDEVYVNGVELDEFLKNQ